MSRFKPGMKVTYVSGYKEPEIGIVKSIKDGAVFVVYHCNNDWDKWFFFNETARQYMV